MFCFLIAVLLQLLDSATSNPITITAIWGDDTTLPCDAYIKIKALVDPGSISVRWERGTSPLVDSTQPSKDRYKLIQDVNYGLQISKVQPTDNGTYSCTAEGMATPNNNTLVVENTDATLAPAGLC